MTLTLTSRCCLTEPAAARTYSPIDKSMRRAPARRRLGIVGAKKLEIGDALPPEDRFAPMGNSGWFAHPAAPDWLLKSEDGVYVHVPSGSLWRRRGRELVPEDFYRCLVVGSFSGGSPKVLLRAAWSAWRREATEARLWHDGGADTTVESPVPRPTVRVAARGLRRTRQGVSPPPERGWSDAGEGWQCHPTAKKWLRKETDSEGEVFFYLPNESLWVQMRQGVFVCVDTYHAALAAFISSSTGMLLRTCLMSWRNQASVVGTWRKRIRVMASLAGAGAASEAEDVKEEATPSFPVQTAFLVPTQHSRGRNSRGCSAPPRSR